jgi:hypothetical protein
MSGREQIPVRLFANLYWKTLARISGIVPTGSRKLSSRTADTAPAGQPMLSSPNLNEGEIAARKIAGQLGDRRSRRREATSAGMRSCRSGSERFAPGRVFKTGAETWERILA